MKDKEFYFDKNGIEIKNGDVLKVFHFKHGKRRRYMMWKIVHYLKEWGWIALHSGISFDPASVSLKKGFYNLLATSNEDGILIDSEIVSLDICHEHSLRDKSRKRIKLNA